MIFTTKTAPTNIDETLAPHKPENGTKSADPRSLRGGHQAEGSLTGPLCFSSLEEQNASVNIGSRAVRVRLRSFTFVYFGSHPFVSGHGGCRVILNEGTPQNN